MRACVLSATLSWTCEPLRCEESEYTELMA